MDKFDFLKAKKPAKRPGMPKREKEICPYVKISLDAAVTLLELSAVAAVRGVSVGGVRADAMMELQQATMDAMAYIEREHARRENAKAEKREQKKRAAEVRADFRDFMGL